MLFRTAEIQVHVAHFQRLPYCTVVLGTAVARKATQPRSTLRTLGLNALVPRLLLTAGLSPPASKPPS